MKRSSTPAAPPPRQASDPAPRLVLVVDDEPVVLTVTSRMLTSAGYGVIQALSAREALRVLELGDPRIDLVITDVVMPETDGRALGRLIGEQHPAVPVLYMSAYPAEDVFHRGSPGAGLPFLRKPFSLEQLLNAIASTLDCPTS